MVFVEVAKILRNSLRLPLPPDPWLLLVERRRVLSHWDVLHLVLLVGIGWGQGLVVVSRSPALVAPHFGGCLDEVDVLAVDVAEATASHAASHAAVMRRVSSRVG